MEKLQVEKWMTFFERNARNRPEPRWDAPVTLDACARRHLEKSLQEFQLGDGGGPGALIAWNVEQYRQRWPGFGAVLDAWFREEHEHSRLLGGLLERYEVEPIKGHWSFSLFCFLRRILGIDFELQILTLTELSSTAYYRLLREFGQDAALVDVCNLILRDESGHLAFQCDRLACSGTPGRGPGRVLWCAQFWVFGMCAASVLYASHGKALRLLGVSPRTFYAEAHRQFCRFIRRVSRRYVRVWADSCVVESPDGVEGLRVGETLSSL